MKEELEVEEQMNTGTWGGSSGRYFAFCSHVSRKKIRRVEEAGVRGVRLRLLIERWILIQGEGDFVLVLCSGQACFASDYASGKIRWRVDVEL